MTSVPLLASVQASSPGEGRASPRPARAADPEDLADFAATLADAARSWQAETDGQRMLDAVLRTATIALPGVRRASISLLQPKQHLTTAARTDDVIAAVDDIQYGLRQGPTVDAALRRQTVRTDDVAADPRWPECGPRAASAGVRSILSLHLYVFGTSLGALNLASDHRTAFDEQAELLGTLFAAHAAVAMTSRRQEVKLQAALAHRDVIGQAKGIFMHRHRVSADEAFTMLVETSQETNIKLYEVAQYVVDHAEHSARRSG